MSFDRGFLSPGEIVDRIVAVEGLYERVFGKLLDYLVFHRKVESDFQILQKIYGYKNVRDCLPRKVVRKDFKYLSSTVFRFSEEAERRSASMSNSAK